MLASLANYMINLPTGTPFIVSFKLFNPMNKETITSENIVLAISPKSNS